MTRVAADADAPFAAIGIAGLGLIGGSIALAVRRRWPSVRVVGVDAPAVIASALARGAIDESRPAVADLGGCDLVLLAVPVPAILSLLPECRTLSGLVTDVGSTKRRIVEAARAGGVRAFVGGHPMAGAAAGGLESASAGLFTGRPWILVNESASLEHLHRVQAFVSGLGAHPAALDAETHDRTVAHVSHLPQLLALALMSSAGDAVGDAGLACAGPGFADMTRLAASPIDVWQGIFETNADCIAAAVRDLIARLPGTPVDLSGDRAAALFTSAHAWHRRWREAPGA